MWPPLAQGIAKCRPNLICLLLAIAISSVAGSPSPGIARRDLTASLQPLVNDLYYQIKRVGKHDRQLEQHRIGQLQTALNAWNASGQTRDDYRQVDAWLRRAIRASLPGSFNRLPPLPTLSQRHAASRSSVVPPPPQQRPSPATPSPPTPAPVTPEPLPPARAKSKTSTNRPCPPPWANRTTKPRREPAKAVAPTPPIVSHAAPQESNRVATANSLRDRPRESVWARHPAAQPIDMGNPFSDDPLSDDPLVPQTVVDEPLPSEPLPSEPLPSEPLPSETLFEQPPANAPMNHSVPGRKESPTESFVENTTAVQVNQTELDARIRGYLRGLQTLERRLLLHSNLSAEELLTITQELQQLASQRQFVTLYLESLAESEQHKSTTLPTPEEAKRLIATRLQQLRQVDRDKAQQVWTVEDLFGNATASPLDQVAELLEQID